MEDPVVGECAERLSSSCALESQRELPFQESLLGGLPPPGTGGD